MPATRLKNLDTPKAREHLRSADPVLGGLIERVGPIGPDSPEGRDPADHYGALVRAIVGQQLSTKAARAIYGRLLEHFDGHVPTPQQVLDADPDQMRVAAGLSRAKTSFLRSLAEHVLSGQLELERMNKLGDDEVIAELVAVKGIGEWSAHMFLMFHLRRPDVMAVGDLGIRRAVQIAYGMAELPDAAALHALSEPWRPYRTLACRYLWRSLDNEPD
jgi:DNA-3-methyladenine glycosylase II